MLLGLMACLLMSAPALGYSLPQDRYYPYKASQYQPEYRENTNAESEEFPDYEIVQLSPEDVQRISDIEGALISPAQAKALQEQVWLDPALPEIRYPAQDPYLSEYEDQEYSDSDSNDAEDSDDSYDLPEQTYPAFHKKDIEQLQFFSGQGKLPKNPAISYRKTPRATEKPTSLPKELTAERRGMKEEAIFRPESARDPQYRGRR